MFQAKNSGPKYTYFACDFYLQYRMSDIVICFMHETWNAIWCIWPTWRNIRCVRTYITNDILRQNKYNTGYYVYIIVSHDVRYWYIWCRKSYVTVRYHILARIQIQFNVWWPATWQHVVMINLNWNSTSCEPSLLASPPARSTNRLRALGVLRLHPRLSQAGQAGSFAKWCGWHADQELEYQLWLRALKLTCRQRVCL